MKLIKLSDPGWDLTFDSEEELKEELFQHICEACCAGNEKYEQDPVNFESSIGAMLATQCGCEFWVEKDEIGRAHV